MPQENIATYNWSTQTVDSTDVTVAYVAGKLFAAECSRKNMRGVDSRVAAFSGEITWNPCELSTDEQNASLP